MMFGKRFALFRLSGIAVRVDVSWMIIAAIITFSLAEGLFPQRFFMLSRPEHWVMAVLGTFGLFVSIIIHELAHGVAALGLGIPMHGITLFLFGGVAEMAEEPKTPGAELWMAAAGPLASILLAVLFVPFALDPQLIVQMPMLAGTAEYLAVMNLMVAVFNLLPAFPLDGGRILRAVLWWATKDMYRATRFAAGAGRLFGIGFIALGLFEVISFELIAGAWWILIGLFLRSAARTALEQADPASRLWQNASSNPPLHGQISPSRHTQPNLAS